MISVRTDRFSTTRKLDKGEWGWVDHWYSSRLEMVKWVGVILEIGGEVRSLREVSEITGKWPIVEYCRMGLYAHSETAEDIDESSPGKTNRFDGFNSPRNARWFLPSLSCTSSIRPLNMALNMVSSFVNVSKLDRKRWFPTFNLTYFPKWWWLPDMGFRLVDDTDGIVGVVVSLI